MSLARPLSLTVLVLSVALAGCSGGDDDGGGEASSSLTQSGPQGNGTTLAAVIKVLVGGNVTAPDNGSIPVDANERLTFDGSNSTGPIVEYAWDFGDNSTGADETETHSYAAGGLYNVTLTVKGLGNASANATVRIQVAEDASGGYLFTQAETFEGDLTVGNPNACNVGGGTDCMDHVVTIVGADANGTAALANNVTIILDGSGATAVNMQVYWRSPEPANLAQSPASGQDQTLTYSGDMPPGDYVVRVRLNAGFMASYTVAVAVDYVSV